MTKNRKNAKRKQPTTSNDKLIQSSPPESTADAKTSLARRLKKHRGTAANTPPPPKWDKTNATSTNKQFLTPRDRTFQECLTTSYAGFRYDPPTALPDRLHDMFGSAFRGMNDLFLYDVVQPGKKRLTRTSVTRTLVGEPGSTYKYLGLRLFSHPWKDCDERGNSIDCEPSKQTEKNDHDNYGVSLRKLGYSDNTVSALIAIGRANEYLKHRSNELIDKYISPNVGLAGSAEFNLTLVNKMASTTKKRDLKKETVYGMGKFSVGWHRDSGLKDFSSIAVYQTLEGSLDANKDEWGVALRAMDGGAGGPLTSVTPLVVPLPSGSVYYMLDDFNHNHEHAVVAGADGVRYSSTHRVAREGQGTWQHIRDRVEHFFESASKYDFSRGIRIELDLPAKKHREQFVSLVKGQQLLMNEIEFEWIRQWFVQGLRHSSLHHYWQQPIEILCESFCRLEKLTITIVNMLREEKNASAHGGIHINVLEELYDVLIDAFTEKSTIRKAWKDRYLDPLFDQIPAEERPMPCSCLDRNETKSLEENLMAGQLPQHLDDLIVQLRRWRSAFVNPNSIQGDQPALKRKQSNSGSMTRKEQKTKASNWEQLKKRL